MTMLGYVDPVHRVLAVLRGLLTPSGGAPPGAGAPPRTRIVGHRGAARECPENTLVSFRQALALGAEGFETDVCRTRDGAFVLWHDADPAAKVALARQCGAERLFAVPEVPDAGSTWRRPVRELALEDMRRHYRYRRCGPRTDSGPGAAEPTWPFDTLEGLFDWLEEEGARPHVYLDIKLDEDQAGAARDIVRAIRDRFAPSRGAGPTFHLLSTQREIVAALLAETQAAERDLMLPYADFERPGAAVFARRLEVRNVSLGGGDRLWRGLLREVEDVLVEQRRGTFDRVAAWTFNDAHQLRELMARGVDAVLTDDVPLMRRLRSAGLSLSTRAAAF